MNGNHNNCRRPGRWPFCSLMAVLMLTLAGVLRAQNVQFTQSSTPAGIVNQTTFPLAGTVVSTVTAPATNGAYHFAYWTLNGVRWADPSGTATNPATFTANGAVSAVANYLPTAQDSDGDGLPDWWEQFYFGTLAYSGTDDPDGDGFSNAYEYAFGLNPAVADVPMAGGISRRRGQPFLNVAVGDGNVSWDYGGVSRRRSATTTVVINTAAYAVLQEISSPATIINRTRVVAKGTTVPLSTPPDPAFGYRYTGWLIGGVRYDNPTQVQPIPITVTQDTVAVARYIPATDDTDGDGIPDWLEWFYFNSLQYDQNSIPNGDGFTIPVDLLRGFSPVVVNVLSQGGISRRRSATFTIAAGQYSFRITSDPGSILEQTQYLNPGSLVTVPDKNGATFANYKFAWWDLNGAREQDASGTALTTFSFTLNMASTATAHYVDPTVSSDGGGLTDWYEWAYFGGLGHNATDLTPGDGYTIGQDILRGFSPKVANILAQGGVSRRRGGLVPVNAVFLPIPPIVGVISATRVSANSATLNALVNPVGSSTTIFFEWGPTAAYGNQTATQNIGSGLAATNCVADITGLTAYTQYHFHMVATDIQGTTQGSDGTFFTLPNNYADFQFAHGLGGPLEDTGQTGLPNLVKFAFGMDPITPDRSLLPMPQKTDNNYVLSFTQPSNVTSVTYGALWSPDMSSGSWQPVPDTGSGMQHIFSVPIGAHTQIFMKVSVTGQ